MRRQLRLYFRYISVTLRSSMQYKLSFFLMIIGRFFVAFGGFLSIYFLFSGFTNIKGYTMGEVLLCFSVMQMSFACAECIARGFNVFSFIVNKGEFDRMLVRPVSPILQVLGSRFELGRIGPMISAMVMLVVGIRNCEIMWTVSRVICFVLMLFGGILLFSGLFMIGATICFFSIEDGGSINVLTYGAKEHGKYPIDIYGKNMMRFCTYVIPYTLIQYYPLQYLLGKSEHWYYGIYPLGAVVFLTLCYIFWRFGVRHYASSGS